MVNFRRGGAYGDCATDVGVSQLRASVGAQDTQSLEVSPMPEADSALAEDRWWRVMSFIPSYQSLGTHRKTLRAASLLKIDRVLMVGHLHYLWWWGVDNVPATGDITRVTDEEIALAAEWRGDAREFAHALIEAGFIDAKKRKRFFHNWEEYIGKMLRKRESDRLRMRAARSANTQRTFTEPSTPNVAGTSRERSRYSIVENSRLEETREDADAPPPPSFPPASAQNGTAPALAKPKERIWQPTSIKPSA